MPTLTEIRKAADTWGATFWPLFRQFQTAYTAKHGRPWQGLRTAASITDDGGDNTITARVPSDHRIDREYVSDGVDDKGEPIGHWTDKPDRGWAAILKDCIGTAPSVLKFALQSDIYSGPDGDGYALTMYVRADGKVYARTVQTGPEKWRAQAWHKVEEVTA